MKYIGKYKGNVGTTHGTLVSGLVGYYNRIINLSKYLIGGNFYSYSPNVNLLDDYKNSISIIGTYNQTNYEYPPLNGLTTNILVTLDNSTQIDPEFSVMKINRLNSGVNQADYLQFQHYEIEPEKTMEMSFWYYGTYGTTITLYSQDTETYVERWDASTNAYITNESKYCSIPVTTNTWQYIQVRARNTHTTINKQSIRWLRLHDNQRITTLSNTEYWKITCVKHWYVESITKNKIIRLNYDDSIDDTWYNNNSYTSGSFWELIYDNINKKIYGAGDPALDGGLVRFNLDGTKDNTFNIGTGFNNKVRSIIIDNTNSKIYACGEFTTFQGNTQNRLVRLHLDGSLDNTFNIGTGFNSHVWNFILVNSKFYVVGNFTSYNGTTINRVISLNLDGTINTYFNVGTGFNGLARYMCYNSTDSKFYVVGNFTSYKGTTINRICRLNLDGSLDTSFDVGTGFNNGAYAINIDTINQKIYVGGIFTTFNGNTQNRLIRLNLDGSKDTSFNIGTGLDSYITTSSGILIDNEKNKIYITGEFTIYNGQQQKYIARLNMDGSLDNTFNIQLSHGAMTILKYTE